MSPIVDPRVEEYVEAHTTPPPPDLVRLAEETRATLSAPQMLTGTVEGRFLQALDKLPPIKLPVGPAIPWRIGLPLLVALSVVMLVMSRPGSAPVCSPRSKIGVPAATVVS